MLMTVVGDPHAKPDNLDKINKLFDVIEDLGNTCIILGDLLDTKELIRGRCLNTYLERMGNSKLAFVVLAGNHDWFNLDCKDHSLQMLKLLPNVIVVDKPQTHFGCHFWPYMKNFVPTDWKDLDRLPVFCHMDAPGFDYGNGHLSDHGIDYRNLRRFPVVISGHYHCYQRKEFMTYLGTPFSHSFGESNQDKYLGIFDTETQQLELLPSVFPQHITQEINAQDDPGDHHLDNLGSIDQNYYRIILTGPQDAIAKWNITNYPHIRWIIRPTENGTADTTINETQAPEVQFSNWAKDIADLDQDVVKLGLEVLKNV